MRTLLYAVLTLACSHLCRGDQDTKPLVPGEQTTEKSSWSTDLSSAYGFVMGQEFLLKRISEKTPQLATEAAEVSLLFSQSALGKGAAQLESELSRVLSKDDLEKLYRESSESIQQTTSQLDFTEEKSRDLIDSIRKLSKGELPEKIRATLLAVNPQFVKDPGSEIGSGWRQRFSLKDNPAGKKVPFTIDFPLSWSKREGRQNGAAKVFRSQCGHGPIVCTITAKRILGESDPSPTQAEIDEIFAPDSLKDMAPGNATSLKCISTRIGETKVGQLEFEIIQEAAGAKVAMKCTSFNFFVKDSLVVVAFSVLKDNLPPQAYATAQEANLPTYRAILSTVTFGDSNR